MPHAAEGHPRRALSAILIADIKGYSRLMGQDEEATIRRVTESVSLMRGLVTDYGGRIRNVAGDGVLSTFDTALGAVEFAITIQKEFEQDEIWRSPDERLEFRIGINIGDVVEEEGNIHGNAVNVAARIEGHAPPGGICMSEAVYLEVRSRLDVPVQRLGEYQLKNIKETVALYAVGGGEAEGVAKAPAVAKTDVPVVDRKIELPELPSIAVLPLQNVSGDTRDDHLCDGITDDVITNLSRFRDLFVIARHSSFLFRDLSFGAKQIAARLGVRYLLTGQLRRAANKVRITVQLIEAESEAVVWSERYDGDLSDVFDFEDDLTDTISARLATQINAAERRRTSTIEAPDLRAYGLMLRGQHMGLTFKKESNLHARRLFETAATIDPGYGRPYAGMSRTHNLDWRYAWTNNPEASLERAVDLANMAIVNDAQDARGYSELGFSLLYQRKHNPSLAAYERAREINPNDADVLAELGDLHVYIGEPAKGAELLKRAMRLNPYYPDWYLWGLGDAYFYLQDYDAAVSWLQRMRDPSEAHRLLCASYAHLGRLEDARRHAKMILEKHPNFSIEHWRKVPPHDDPDRIDLLVDGLQKAGLK